MDINFSAYDGSSKTFWENYWSTPYFLYWMDNYWTSCIWIAALYVILAFGGKYYMKDKKPFEVRTLLFLWNIFLAIFSIFGTYRMLPELLFSLDRYGFHYSVCSSTFYKGNTGIWGALFAVSKVVELVDTLFIVLKKRPLIFLHWYHHIITLWVCWYAGVSNLAVGRWYAVMNYVVHSIMYTYYGFRTLKFRIPIFVNQLITTIQILQMIIGIYVTYSAYVYMNSGLPCHGNSEVLIYALLMYFSFFILFANYFFKTYIRPKPAKSCHEKNGVKDSMNGATNYQYQNGFPLKEKEEYMNGATTNYQNQNGFSTKEKGEYMNGSANHHHQNGYSHREKAE